MMKNLKFLISMLFIQSWAFGFISQSPLICERNILYKNSLGSWKLNDTEGNERSELDFRSYDECFQFKRSINEDYYCSIIFDRYEAVRYVVGSVSQNKVVLTLPIRWQFAPKDLKCHNYLPRQKIVKQRICVPILVDYQDKSKWYVVSLSSGSLYKNVFSSFAECREKNSEDKEIKEILSKDSLLEIGMNIEVGNFDLTKDRGRPIGIIDSYIGYKHGFVGATVVAAPGLEVYAGWPGDCRVGGDKAVWCPNKKIMVPGGARLKPERTKAYFRIQKLGGMFDWSVDTYAEIIEFPDNLIEDSSGTRFTQGFILRND